MRRLYGLQYVRGVAACCVVAYHAADRAGVRFGVGEAGVDLFFVLSGFLMWAITDETSHPVSFLADRIKRIVPTYWLATTVMLAGALAGLFPAVRLTVDHVAASYAFLPWTSPSNGQVWPLLVPGWTLNYEMAFYALFALVLMVPRVRQLRLLTLVLVELAVEGAVLQPHTAAMRFYTDPHQLEFLGGLWLGRLWEKQALSRPMAVPLALVAILGFLVSIALPHGWPKPVLYGLPSLLAVAAVLAFERRAGGIPNWPVLQTLGDASYSIYLWHTLALSVAARVGHMLALPAPLVIAMNITAGLGVGLVAYRLVERPLIRWMHRPRERPLASLTRRLPLWGESR
jgi:exopolysaccharide production protein ExoZ